MTSNCLETEQRASLQHTFLHRSSLSLNFPRRHQEQANAGSSTRPDTTTTRFMKMHIATLSLAISAAAPFVTAQSPPPFNGTCVPKPNFPDWTPPQLQLVVNNASETFGFQLVGRAQNVSELQAVCDQIVWKWASIGLTDVRIQEPACTWLEHYPTVLPPTGLVNQAILQFNTQILLTQLLNSFAACPLPFNAPQDPASPFTYLCHNLQRENLDAFGIGGIFLIERVCAAANIGWEPEDPAHAPVANVSATALAEFEETRSLLFASTLAIRPDTLPQLQQLCNTSTYASNLTAMHLNASLIQDYFCDLGDVVSASSSNWMMYMSRAFVQVLLGASNAVGWAEWLCENLDERRMHDLYLRERAVKLGVCEGVNGAEGWGVVV